jgi:hypothetical protein
LEKPSCNLLEEEKEGIRVVNPTTKTTGEQKTLIKPPTLVKHHSP